MQFNIWIMENLESNLKEICRKKGLTLTDVANRMCTSPSNLLSCVKGNPTISKIQSIANALQVSVSDLLTMRPEKTQGVAIIDGKTYQLTRPAVSTVQLPFYDRYDTLRNEVKGFVKKATETGQNASMMGILESFEIFCLIYDAHNSGFILSLYYANGKYLMYSYHEMDYAAWKKGDEEDKLEWDMPFVLENIISDIEGAVPMKLYDQ